MLTVGLSVISVVVSLMYVHRLYFCCCIFCFLQNRFKIFCIICAYRGVIVISVTVSVPVLYVHGLYWFCCIFFFCRTGLCSLVFMLTGLLCVCTCISLLSNIYFKACVSNYKNDMGIFCSLILSSTRLLFYFIFMSASSCMYGSRKWFCNESPIICPVDHTNMYIHVPMLIL